MKPSLRAVLLVQLAFLAATALILGVATSILASTFAPGEEFPLVMAIVAGDVVIFIAFGHYLVTRLVLKPLAELHRSADAVIQGNLDARAPAAETADFTQLGERFNRMTDHLLDAQSQLVRAEKLATVGRLAAGIAHEIGNPLGGASTYLEVLRRRAAEPEVVEALRRELDRIDKIVRSLLDYARPREEALQPVDVAVVLSAALELLRAQGALHSTRAELDIPTPVPRILGRAHELEQAVVNLLLNAVDAAPHGSLVLGARLWGYAPERVIPRRAGDTSDAFFPRAPSRRPSRTELESGTPGVLIFVADSGAGIPAADRDKVFEPFYTTKEPGRGTGLGLAIVARVVFEMGGVVWLEQAREGGAAFKIFLPAEAS
ncbi:MAG TPA: ATP-binding protein [Gemmatimonadales bacterium]|nr:ATP-binding protein [Gemmatimonadales bacterium]